MDELTRIMTDIILSARRERSVLRQHPWVLSGAVAKEPGASESGAWVRVLSDSGGVLGHGHYSANSSIRVRLLAFGKEDPGEALLERRIEAALARRRDHPLLTETTGLRLVNSEGDGLPGLVVDRMGDVLVVKFLTAGMHARADRIARCLEELTDAPHGYRRRDDTSARREGISPDEGVLWGNPSGLAAIEERGRRYAVNLALNQVECPVEVRHSDAFEALRTAAEAGEKYDLIVLDPPPLARSRRAVQAASRAYKDMLLHALRCASPSAFILAFSCSHHIDPDLFQKIVFGAALDAHRGVRWLRTLGAPADHPFSIYHPEGRYLNGCLLEVESDGQAPG